MTFDVYKNLLLHFVYNFQVCLQRKEKKKKRYVLKARVIFIVNVLLLFTISHLNTFVLKNQTNLNHWGGFCHGFITKSHKFMK